MRELPLPETGFTDFAFHDVGQRHDLGENELNARPPVWAVNTPSLVGAWDSPPYVGAALARDPESMVEEILDFRSPAHVGSHGTPGGLTRRQVQDLAEFVDSLDGATTAAEVRAAADTLPPRVVRVEPASLTRVDVWFSESVAPQAASPAAWRLEAVGGPDVPVVGAALDPQNGDRVTLTVGTMHHDCGPVTYRLVPLGPIPDLADTAGGGSANLLDVADPANTRTFVIGTTLTVTLGASGYENLTVPVHDAGTIFGSNNGANGTVWLRSGGGVRNVDLLRFEWESALAAAGVARRATSSTHPSRPSRTSGFADLRCEARAAEVVGPRRWRPGPEPVGNGHGGPTYSTASSP